MSGTPTEKALRWGIVGTGSIATVFCDSITKSGVGSVKTVLSRQHATGRSFARKYDARPFTKESEFLEDNAIEAVYIATPHSAHSETALHALAAGVPVLCEKPLCVSESETARVVRAAKENSTPLLEAYMYRFHPQITALVELIQQGRIGQLQHIESCFGFVADVDTNHRLRNPKLGGGAILDVGGYPLSIALLAAGATEGQPFLQPATLVAHVQEDSTGVDSHATVEIEFDRGLTAKLTTSISEDLGMGLTCHGNEGEIHLPTPFLPSWDRHGTSAQLHLKTGDNREILDCVAPFDCYSLEAAFFSKLIQRDTGGKPRPHFVDPAESRLLAELLESWRKGGHHAW